MARDAGDRPFGRQPAADDTGDEGGGRVLETLGDVLAILRECAGTCAPDGAWQEGWGTRGSGRRAT